MTEGELRLVVVVIVFFLASKPAARGREKEGGSTSLEWLKCWGHDGLGGS